MVTCECVRQIQRLGQDYWFSEVRVASLSLPLSVLGLQESLMGCCARIAKYVVMVATYALHDACQCPR